MLARPRLESILMRITPAPMRRLLWLLAVLYALYLIAGNVFINTVASAQVNRKPETFHAQWSWAWTLWPGQLHVYDLSLRGHARKLLWSAHGDSAGGRIMLWPLLRRELRFASVRAGTVSVDVQPTPVDHKPLPFNSDAWRVTVTRLQTASLQQIRWGSFVVDGHGSGEIGFTHQLRGGATQIYASHIEMPAAHVSYGRWPLLHAAKFVFTFAFDPFTHDDPAGWQKAERAVGRIKIDAATMPIALGADRQGAAAIASALPGHLSADVAFAHGALQPGGLLQWNAPVAITDADGTQQQRRGQLDLDILPASIALHVRIPPPAGVAQHDAMNQLQAYLQYGSRQLLPSRPWADELRQLSATLNARWHFASLQWLDPLLASRPWLHLDGAGDIAAALKLDRGRLVDGSHLEIPHVQLRADVLGNVFAGDAHATVRVAGNAAVTKTTMAMNVDQFTLTSASKRQQPYLRGKALQLTTQSSADLVHLRDTLDAHLRFADAAVPDLRVYNHYLPGKSLQILSGSGRLGADLHINGHGDVSQGHLQLHSTDTHFALGVSRLSGNLSMDTQLTLALNEGSRVFDLDDLSLGLQGVHVDGSHDAPWWARFTIEHGQLDWSRPMRLRGSASMVMKDVSLLLSLFADRSAFPKWITHVINDGQATAHAQVQMQKGDFVLDQLAARNQRVELFAHLRVRDGQPQGDLYARWGILGLGVALADGKRQFHLLHARAWYEAQPDLIPAAVTSPH